jgi:hypothetical protein
MTSPSKNPSPAKTYTATFELVATTVEVTVAARSLEDAVEVARESRLADFFSTDVCFLDGQLELTGVWS